MRTSSARVEPPRIAVVRTSLSSCRAKSSVLVHLLEMKVSIRRPSGVTVAYGEGERRRRPSRSPTSFGREDLKSPLPTMSTTTSPLTLIRTVARRSLRLPMSSRRTRGIVSGSGHALVILTSVSSLSSGFRIQGPTRLPGGTRASVTLPSWPRPPWASVGCGLEHRTIKARSAGTAWPVRNRMATLTAGHLRR